MAGNGKRPYFTDLQGAVAIDDGNWQQYSTWTEPLKHDIEGLVSATGYMVEQKKNAYGSVAGVTDWPTKWTYSDKELRELIEEQDRKQCSLYHIARRAPKKWNNQSPTNYCWMFATVHGVMLLRWLQGLDFIRLNPFSCGCLVDGYRNRGGYGSEGLKQLIEFGVSPESLWPFQTPEMNNSEIGRANNAAISRRFDTPEMRAASLNYRVTEWNNFRGKNYAAKASAILRYIPVSCGYNWMGHQMLGIRAVVNRDGSIGFVDLDSYASGGAFNERLLSQSRGTGDDMCAPRVIAMAA